MAILYLQNLPFCNIENVPKSIEKFPKVVQHFAKYLENSQTVAKDF